MAAITFKNQQTHTLVSNIFIDEYMPLANPTFVLVYIYCLRNSTSADSMETKDIAKALNILETDVVNAWNYWQEKEVLRVIAEDKGSIEMIFLSVLPQKEEKKSKQSKKPVSVFQIKPNYSAQELDIYIDKSEDVRQLFSIAQKSLGKLLTYNDMSTLFGFYDWLMLPMEVIEFLITYCASNNHRSMRYIEKTALDWAENDINTIEAAEEHVKLFNTDYREIMKSFGINRREPVFSEQEFMKKWIFTYKLPIDVLKLACEKTVIQTGKANFPYADKIIGNWYTSNVQGVDDINKLEEEFHSKPKNDTAMQPSKPKKSSGKKNKFLDYEQREWNLDDLKQLEG